MKACLWGDLMRGSRESREQQKQASLNCHCPWGFGESAIQPRLEEAEGPSVCRRGPLVTGHPGQTCPRKGLTYQPVMPPGDTGQWAGMSGLVRT